MMLRRIVLALSALIASAGLVLGAYGQQVPYSSGINGSSGGTLAANAVLAWPDGSNISNVAASTLGMYGPSGSSDVLLGTSAILNGASTTQLQVAGAAYFVAGSNYNRSVYTLSPYSDNSASLGDGTYRWKSLNMYYVNTGRVGAVTINAATGRVNIAAAGTSVVVNNNIVSANSHIFCNVSNVDTTAKTCQVTPGASTFTITLGAAATAQVAVDFFVVGS